MNDELMQKMSDIFQSSIIEVLRTVSGMDIRKVNGADGEPDNFAGVLPLAGDIGGLFIIQAGAASLRTLTSYITGSDESSIDAKEMADCIGELANMVCGSARARAAGAKIGFALSTPFSILGTERMEFFFKRSAKMLSLSFSSGEISIRAKVVFA